MNIEGPTVIGDVGWDGGVFFLPPRVTRNAGLNMPVGTNAGPWRQFQNFLCIERKRTNPIPSKVRRSLADVRVTIGIFELKFKLANALV